MSREGRASPGVTGSVWSPFAQNLTMEERTRGSRLNAGNDLVERERAPPGERSLPCCLAKVLAEPGQGVVILGPNTRDERRAGCLARRRDDGQQMSGTRM